ALRHATASVGRADVRLLRPARAAGKHPRVAYHPRTRAPHTAPIPRRPHQRRTHRRVLTEADVGRVRWCRAPAAGTGLPPPGVAPTANRPAQISIAMR